MKFFGGYSSILNMLFYHLLKTAKCLFTRQNIPELFSWTFETFDTMNHELIHKPLPNYMHAVSLKIS